MKFILYTFAMLLSPASSNIKKFDTFQAIQSINARYPHKFVLFQKSIVFN
jgi:hypothetical protein